MLDFVRRLFLCRHYHGLAYESQCEDATRRARRRANKSRNRLASEPWKAFAVALEAKPRGMWSTTFNRLHGNVVATDKVADTAHLIRLMKVLRRIDRRVTRAAR
jgi:hypothetical protein